MAAMALMPTRPTTTRRRTTIALPPNFAPNAPSDVSPASGTTDLSPTLTLTASTFSDVNIGDTQGAAEWQVIRVIDGSVTFDSGGDVTDLNAFTVPGGAWRIQRSISGECVTKTITAHGALSNAFPVQHPASAEPLRPRHRRQFLQRMDRRGCRLRRRFWASAFSDPDTGDSQPASEWQLVRMSDLSIAYDSGVDVSDLNSLTVPGGTLAYSTTYQWRVRYEDSHSTWSAF